MPNQNTGKSHCNRGHEFSIENTGRSKVNGRYCKQCKRIKQSEWQATSEGKKKRAKYWLKWKYDFNQEEFETVLKAQNNCCLLCKKAFSNESGMEPVVDHCHKTGVRRGLIHRTCNMAIGLLKDDPVLCQLAANYLLSTPALS